MTKAASLATAEEMILSLCKMRCVEQAAHVLTPVKVGLVSDAFLNGVNKRGTDTRLTPHHHEEASVFDPPQAAVCSLCDSHV